MMIEFCDCFISFIFPVVLAVIVCFSSSFLS